MRVFNVGSGCKTVLKICMWAVMLAVQKPCRADKPSYPVGVTTVQLTDSSRTDAFTHRARQLVTDVWYPAEDAARQLPDVKLSSFYPAPMPAEISEFFRKGFGMEAGGHEVDATYRMHAHRDARLRRGKWPVIIFSHGNGGFRYQNTFWFEHMCALGYIVISADHTANAGITALPEGVVKMQASERLHSSIDRVADVRFLLDSATAWNSDSKNRFYKKFDLTSPCAAGMSFGSMTAVKVADVDSRFKLVIAMSGAYPEHTKFTVPTLWMIGTEDRTIGIIGNNIVRGHHAKQQGPSVLFEMKNGGHFSFTDVPQFNPQFGDGAGKGKRWAGGAEFNYTSAATTYQMINEVTARFLAAYQRGDKAAVAAIGQNRWPDELTLDVRNAAAAAVKTPGDK